MRAENGDKGHREQPKKETSQTSGTTTSNPPATVPADGPTPFAEGFLFRISDSQILPPEMDVVEIVIAAVSVSRQEKVRLPELFRLFAASRDGNEIRVGLSQRL